MRLRRRRQSRPSIKDLSHSARPSIRGYGSEEDTTDSEGEESASQKLQRVGRAVALAASLCYSQQEGTAGEQPAEPVSERQSQDAQRDASQCG